MASVDLVVDCDPGHDDAVALAVATRRGRLLGVTTVAGNAPLAATTRNALAVVQMLDRDLAGVEVHSGADVPLAGRAVAHARQVHGASGLDGATLPELRRAVASTDAARFLVEITRDRPGTWIVAVGPLTNVARALQLDPSLVQRIAGISIMGGGTYGNVTAAAEFNVHFDPEAAAVVLDSGARIVMCGLDLTHQLTVDDTFVARLRALGTPFGDLCADALACYIANIRHIGGPDAPVALHDPCAVLAVTDPSLMQLVRRRVVVETRGAHTRGMTVVDARPGVEGGNIEWAVTIDARAATELVIEAIAAAR